MSMECTEVSFFCKFIKTRLHDLEESFKWTNPYMDLLLVLLGFFCCLEAAWGMSLSYAVLKTLWYLRGKIYFYPDKKWECVWGF